MKRVGLVLLTIAALTLAVVLPSGSALAKGAVPPGSGAPALCFPELQVIPGLLGNPTQVANWQLADLPASTTSVPDKTCAAVPMVKDANFPHATFGTTGTEATLGVYFQDEYGVVPAEEGGRLDVNTTGSAYSFGSDGGYLSVAGTFVGDSSANLAQGGLTQGQVGGASIIKIQISVNNGVPAVPNCNVSDSSGDFVKVYPSDNASVDHTTFRITCELYNGEVYMIRNGSVVGHSTPNKIPGVVDFTGYQWTVGAKGNPDGKFVDHTDECTCSVSSVQIGVDADD